VEVIVENLAHAASDGDYGIFEPLGWWADQNAKIELTGPSRLA